MLQRVRSALATVPDYALCYGLGVLVGPALSLAGPSLVRTLAPAVALALAVLGAHWGMGLAILDPRHLAARPGRSGTVLRLALAALAGLTVFVLGRAFDPFGKALAPTIPAALAVAATVAVATGEAVAGMLLVAVAVLVAPGRRPAFGPIAWLGFLVLGGIAARALSGLLQRLRPPAVPRSAMLLAALVAAGAMGMATGVSPLVAGWFLGVLLVNTSRPSPEDRHAVAHWVRPASLTLWGAAGLLCSLPTPWLGLGLVFLAGLTALAPADRATLLAPALAAAFGYAAIGARSVAGAPVLVTVIALALLAAAFLRRLTRQRLPSEVTV